MRYLYIAVVFALLCAALAGPALATESFVVDTFDTDMDSWAWMGWEAATQEGQLGQCEWFGDVGWPGGALHLSGYGATGDNPDNDLREGVYIDKVISTAGKENIRVLFDLYTNLVAVPSNNPGTGCDHTDLNDQMTVFYSTNGGTDWTEYGYIRHTGGNGWEPFETYNNGYMRRLIDLSSVIGANDNAAFALRFRFQFVTGCRDALNGGCGPNGGDWARMDNITVVGHEIGSGDDTTAPGAITGLTVTPLDGFTNVLTWTNPTDTDFAGVIIRYSTTGYPVTLEDGTLLANTSGTSKTHTGVAGGVTYYYSAFAYDYVPNYSAAANATATASSTFWSDSFESPYTVGPLNAANTPPTPGNWVQIAGDLDPLPADRIDIVDTEHATGVHGVKLTHHLHEGTEPNWIKLPQAYSNRNFSYAPPNGVTKFSMRISRPHASQGGGNFWFIYLADTAGKVYGQWYGSDSSFRPRDAMNNAGGATAIDPLNTDGEVDGWYDLDMIVNTETNMTYAFVNGILKFSGTHTVVPPFNPADTPGDTIGRIRINEYGPTGGSFEGSIYIDDIRIGQGVSPNPVINPPHTAGGWDGDTTPTITWQNSTTEPLDKYMIKIYTQDVPDPDNPIYDPALVYNPGEQIYDVELGATHTVDGTTLPENTHLWAFVKEKTKLIPGVSAGQWLPWSPTGMGGFYVYGGTPLAPTVTAPSGTVIGCKPLVTFTAGEHQSFRVKITNSSDVDVWNSGDLPGNGTGASCVEMLTPGTQYKAYAQVSNPAGPGAWSAASLFQVTRTGEGTDLRDMSEEGLLTTDQAPSIGPDMFGKKLNYTNTIMDLWLEGADPPSNPDPSMFPSVEVSCGNSVLQIIDPDHGAATRLMRRHRIANIDLNQGVTYMFAVAVSGQSGTDISGGARWLQSSAMILDDPNVSSDRWLVGIKATQNQVGLLTDNTTWQLNTSTGDSGYKVIRVTGRNRIYNDFSSAEWNLYVNENPTPSVTATGCMHGPTIDPNFWSNWMNDSVLLGQGSGGLAGTFNYDWTSVNISGDYSPGQWDSLEGGAYPSIGAAKKENIQQHAAILSNPCVITKVVTHEEWTMVEPIELITVQDGFFAQDVAGNNAVSGVYVVTADTKEETVIEGALLTSLSGVMAEAAVIPVDGQGAYSGRALFDPSFTVEGSVPYPALALAQKNLIGPCINQNLGSSFDTTGMLVRVFGKITLSGWDPIWPNPETPLGAYILYVDDGSGCDDGRDGVVGIRILVPGTDPEWIAPSYGDYVMVEGIAAYESISGGSYANVRQILYPQFTIVTSGLP